MRTTCLLGLVLLTIQACQPYKNINQDNQVDNAGRTALTPIRASDLFVEYCYDDPTGTSAKSSGAFQETQMQGDENSIILADITRAADFQYSADGGCAMQFTGIDSGLYTAYSTGLIIANRFNQDIPTDDFRNTLTSIETPKGEIVFTVAGEENTGLAAILFIPNPSFPTTDLSLLR